MCSSNKLISAVLILRYLTFYHVLLNRDLQAFIFCIKNCNFLISVKNILSIKCYRKFWLGYSKALHNNIFCRVNQVRAIRETLSWDSFLCQNYWRVIALSKNHVPWNRFIKRSFISFLGGFYLNSWNPFTRSKRVFKSHQRYIFLNASRPPLQINWKSIISSSVLVRLYIPPLGVLLNSSFETLWITSIRDACGPFAVPDLHWLIL